MTPMVITQKSLIHDHQEGSLMFMERSENRQGEEYWRGSERLYRLACRAAMTGESLDQLVRDSTARILAARSNGNLSHLPRIRKSSDTPNLSTSKAAKGSVIALFPPSKRDQ